MNKNTSLSNIVILIPEITKGMKSLGSKALINLHKEYSILDYQIHYIKKYYNNTPIYILTGFDHDRIVKKTKAYSNLFCHFNSDYETNNQVDSILKYINTANPKNFLLINNGVLLKEKLQINDNSNIFMIPKYKDGFTIGSNQNDEKEAKYLFYGLSQQWSECAFFNSQAVQQIKLLSKTKNLNQFFIFELINILIDRNIMFEEKYLINQKNICKINTYQDLKKIKKFYDKNILA